jgi:lipoprotein signal peptidase
MTPLGRRRALAGGAAAAAAAVAVGHELAAVTSLHHPRSAVAVVLMALVAAALVWIVPRLPSAAAALGAGVGAGGSLANLAGALAWSEGVPDPLVLGGAAFNLADVFLLAGDALMLAAAGVYALRHRRELLRPL